MSPIFFLILFMSGVWIGGLFSTLETSYALGVLLILGYALIHFLVKKFRQLGILSTIRSLGLDWETLIRWVISPPKETKVETYPRMILITYYHQGKEYRQAIPRDPNQTNITPTKLKMDKKIIDITQYPGTKYHPPSDLGGDKYA